MRLLLLSLAAIFLAGCELADLETAEGGGGASAKNVATTINETAEPEGEPVETVPGDDSAEWALIRFQGPSAVGARQIMSLGAKIEPDGRHVRFTFDRYPWNDMGLGHFFVWDGANWRGGKFDWIRTGGQSYKTLENIHHGYNGLRPPASGTRCAFAWTDSAGKTRSNLAITTWP